MTEEQLTEKLRYLEGEIRRLKARKPKRWLGLSLLLMMIAIAGLLLLTAGSVTKPYTFSAGTTISASQVNSNFDTLYALVNGNIDSANLVSDAASLAKVSGGLMTANGTNIGIGTTGPARLLHISGPIRLGDSGVPSSPARGDVYSASDGNLYYYNGASWDDLTEVGVGPWISVGSGIAYSGGRVGIGTGGPLSPLHIYGSDQILLRLQNSSSAEAAMVIDGAYSSIWLCNSGAMKARLYSSSWSCLPGGLMIGASTAPSTELHVVGNIYATGTITSGSSRDLKQNIRGLEEDEARLALLSLEPVKFNYKASTDEENLGFVAEDVPQLLATKDRRGVTDMDYIAVLVKVVQEQQKRIEKLENDIIKLQQSF